MAETRGTAPSRCPRAGPIERQLGPVGGSWASPAHPPTRWRTNPVGNVRLRGVCDSVGEMSTAGWRHAGSLQANVLVPELRVGRDEIGQQRNAFGVVEDHDPAAVLSHPGVATLEVARLA